MTSDSLIGFLPDGDQTEKHICKTAFPNNRSLMSYKQYKISLIFIKRQFYTSQRHCFLLLCSMLYEVFIKYWTINQRNKVFSQIENNRKFSSKIPSLLAFPFRSPLPTTSFGSLLHIHNFFKHWRILQQFR